MGLRLSRAPTRSEVTDDQQVPVVRLKGFVMFGSVDVRGGDCQSAPVI